MSMASMKVQKPTVPDAARGTLMSEECEYPYGTRIYLEEAQVAALGLSELPKVGTRLKVEANVVVSGTSLNPSDRDGQGRCLTLQITDLGFADEAQKTDADRATRIYTPTSGNGK